MFGFKLLLTLHTASGIRLGLKPRRGNLVIAVLAELAHTFLTSVFGVSHFTQITTPNTHDCEMNRFLVRERSLLADICGIATLDQTTAQN